MRYKNILYCVVAFLAGCNYVAVERKEVGDEIIEAKFIKDSIVDGIAKFYNRSEILTGYYQYKNGKKEGRAVNFFDNGKVMDSLSYSNDLKNGIQYKFDINGSLILKENYYYGIDVGEHIYFEKGKINEYKFSNFDHEQLVFSKYGTQGLCDSLVFKSFPRIESGFGEKKNPLIKMLIYFPHPPDFEVTYKLGIVDEKNAKQQEIILKSDRLFLDTLLTVNGTDDYYISVDYKNLSKDSTVNFYKKLTSNY